MQNHNRFPLLVWVFFYPGKLFGLGHIYYLKIKKDFFSNKISSWVGDSETKHFTGLYQKQSFQGFKQKR